jgi:hypothetical protein
MEVSYSIDGAWENGECSCPSALVKRAPKKSKKSKKSKSSKYFSPGTVTTTKTTTTYITSTITVHTTQVSYSTVWNTETVCQTPELSPDGTCGPNSKGKYTCGGHKCCNKYGKCATDDDSCGKNCLLNYGRCNR